MVTIECPQCHSKNPDDAEFCEQCGAELPTPVAAVASGMSSPNAGAGGSSYGVQAQPADELVCPKCQAPYVPGDVFCFNCGNDLRSLPGNHPVVPANVGNYNNNPPTVPISVVSNGAAPTNTTLPNPSVNGTDPSIDDWDKAFSNPVAATPSTNSPNQTDTAMLQPTITSAPVTPATSSSPASAFSAPPTPATNNLVQASTTSASRLALDVTGPYGNQNVEFTNHELLLGRNDAKTRVFPDVNLDDSAASRRHASIWLESSEGQFYVQDLESANGTSLNGHDIEPGAPVRLNNGDILKIGTRYSIQVHIS